MAPRTYPEESRISAQSSGKPIDRTYRDILLLDSEDLMNQPNAVDVTAPPSFFPESINIVYAFRPYFFYRNSVDAESHNTDSQPHGNSRKRTKTD